MTPTRYVSSPDALPEGLHSTRYELRYLSGPLLTRPVDRQEHLRLDQGSHRIVHIEREPPLSRRKKERQIDHAASLCTRPTPTRADAPEHISSIWIGTTDVGARCSSRRGSARCSLGRSGGGVSASGSCSSGARTYASCRRREAPHPSRSRTRPRRSAFRQPRSGRSALVATVRNYVSDGTTGIPEFTRVGPSRETPHRTRLGYHSIQLHDGRGRG
ncbi:hypothetical protein DEU38_117106 [Rhodococcus sp. AG1013]|nr:hypothetical protein DEU38_117106 [Rhodococcus sp. AG1013]